MGVRTADGRGDAPAVPAEVLNRDLQDILAPGAWFMAAVCGAYAVFEPHDLGGLRAVTVRTIDTSLALVLLAMGLYFWRRPPSPKFVHPAGAAIVAVLLPSSVVELALSGNPAVTTHFGLTMLAVGYFFVDRRWLVMTEALIAYGWVLGVWLAPGGEAWSVWGICLAVALGTSLVGNRGRVRGLVRNETLRTRARNAAASSPRRTPSCGRCSSISSSVWPSAPPASNARTKSCAAPSAR